MTEQIWEMVSGAEIPSDLYKYRTISVKHLHELQDDFEVLDSEGKISNNEVFRKYIGNKVHELPVDFPEAKSVIVISTYMPLMTVNFHYKGTKSEILVPHYYDDGITEDQLKTTIRNQIIGSKDYRVENANMSVLLKRLAVRSGLGKYGRNNLCYVDGFGSFMRLHAFFTDFEFEEDHWTEVRLMESCDRCKACQSNCPTGAINGINFVIDIEKCIPLYNEVKGEFPQWIPPSSHNALMGCLKCQLDCPANSTAVTQSQKFDDVSEKETKALLEGNSDDNAVSFLWTNLRLFNPEDAWYFVPVFSRNLRVLIRNL